MNAIKATLCTIKVCGFKIFKSDQYWQIYTGFRWYDLSCKQVKLYARKDMSEEQMRCCKHALAKNFPLEELEEWVNLNLSTYKLKCAINGRLDGIPKACVREYVELSEGKCFSRYVELSQDYKK